MNYDTHNLDEATYLALQGHKFIVTRTSSISALFSFERDERLDEARAGFWRGEVNVPLHRWLATRAALKNECKGQAHSGRQVPSPSIVPGQHETVTAIPTGFRYWYRDDDDTVKGAMFGDRLPHTSRIAEGNFYRTREDAQLKRNACRAKGSR